MAEVNEDTYNEIVNEEVELYTGIIYRIVCNITGEVYYGSTFRTLKRRMQAHHKPTNKT